MMEVVCPQSILPVLPVSNNILGVQLNKLENLGGLLAEAEPNGSLPVLLDLPRCWAIMENARLSQRTGHADRCR